MVACYGRLVLVRVLTAISELNATLRGFFVLGVLLAAGGQGHQKFLEASSGLRSMT